MIHPEGNKTVIYSGQTETEA